MTQYQSLGQGVYHLDTLYIEPGVASFYCIIDGGEIAIIETGTSRSLPQLENLLSDLSLSPEQVKYVIPTHVHLDHAGGAGAMMQAFPHAQLIIHPRGARHMINPEQLVNASKAVYGEETFTRLYGEIPPIDENRVIAAEHESTFHLGERELLIVDTPGHAYHHFCVVDLTSRGIFSGDTFGLSYPNYDVCMVPFLVNVPFLSTFYFFLRSNIYLFVSLVLDLVLNPLAGIPFLDLG